MNVAYIPLLGFALVLALAGLGALLRGGVVERYGVLLLTGGWLLSLAAQAFFRDPSPAIPLGIIDLLVLAGLIRLSWKSPHPWPAFACGFQSLALAAGFARWMDPDLNLQVHMTLLAVAGYGAALALMFGAWSKARA